MKIKVGTTELGVMLVESRDKELTVRIPGEADMTAVKTAVEGADEINYTDDEGKLVYKIIGSYKLTFVGGEGDGFVMRFKKTDTLEARIAVLEAENAALREELLNTQEAVEAILGGEVAS